MFNTKMSPYDLMCNYREMLSCDEPVLIQSEASFRLNMKVFH